MTNIQDISRIQQNLDRLEIQLDMLENNIGGIQEIRDMLHSIRYMIMKCKEK